MSMQKARKFESLDVKNRSIFEPNKEVGAIHPKPMPVILTKTADFKIRLSADSDTAGTLQRPLTDAVFNIAPRGATPD